MDNKTNTYFGFSMMIVVAVAVLDIAISSMMCGLHNRGGDADMSAEATTARIAPVAMLNTGAAIAAPAPAAAAAPAAARSGEDVYKGSCFACHGTGAAGAPKVGDAAAWGARIAKGMDALLQSALNGVPGTGMTPKGTCATCSSDELKAAVEYMISNSK
ncbi:MAG: c-type cytochrome [Gammaproteobacteria bacterium]|nr:c-type cytochrome [Gammaproteobacteria bacterium]